MLFMLNWLKRFALFFLIVVVVLLAFLRFQGWQYIAAYTGSGFAESLPDATSVAKPVNCKSEPLSVMSYNVMYGSTTIEAMSKRFRNGDTGHGDLPWSVRLPEISERIVSYAPDLLGLQEMETDADIGAIVPLDQYSLVTYHLGSLEYGDSALLFKTSRYEQLESGQLWLGPTPDLPMSLGYSPLAVIRYVNWVMLREKSTGFTFIYANTHFDNASKNKDPSAYLFHNRVATLTKAFPMVVTGDFNTKANTERYFRFTGMKDNPPLLTNVYDLLSNGASGLNSHPDNLIDHILVGGPCKIKAGSWIVDTRTLKNGKPMSDHNLVFATFQFVPKDWREVLK
jgi:endonuclease/exonuclease/phosphatase family metal-dependent hydrolase